MTPHDRARALQAMANGLLQAADDLVAALAPVEPPAPAPEPPPATAPEPPPAPAPEPPPPPSPTQAPPLIPQRLDLANVVCITSWHRGSRYERWQNVQRLDGAQVRVEIQAINLANGGQLQLLRGTTYRVRASGAVVGERQITSPAPSLLGITLDVSRLPVGWHTLDIEADLPPGAAPESYPTFFGLRAGPGITRMPVWTGSYEVTQLTGGVHYYAWVPSAGPAPMPAPLPPRSYTPVRDLSQVRMQQLVPGGGKGSSYRPARTIDGQWVTATRQPYEWLDLIAQFPRTPLLDGPRGVGVCAYVTGITIGAATQTEDPVSRPRNNIYATDPWRVMRVSDDGTITTLAGYRHRGGAGTYWRDIQDFELVGDWSAVPVERRGFRELWGLAWASETLGVNTAADPIPSEEGRRPHLTGPQAAVADSQRNRVCLLTFPADRHGPARVTELINADDPWHVVDWRGHWIVAERGADRVCQYDRTGRLVRVIVERDPSNAAIAYTDQNRTARLLAGTLAMARMQPCLRPEGLALLGDWLYIGSRVQAMVCRVHLVTGERQTVALLPIESDINARYVLPAVSDGTFGPAGALWVHTWSNSRAAYSGYYVDGQWVTAPQHDGRNLQGYGTAVAVGGGRLYLASMHEGIQRWSARQDSDPPAVVAGGSLYLNGEREWRARGLHLLYGQQGISPFGYPLPADLSPDVWRYLDVSLL